MSKFTPMLGRYASKYEAFSLSPNGTILSVRRQLPEGVTPEIAVRSLRSLFQELAPLAMTDGMILGHFKSAIQSGEAVYALSATRADALDEAFNEAWSRLDCLTGGAVTVNLMSVVPVAITQEQLEAAVAQIF